MIALKKQVNALALELGREVPFALAFLAKPNDGADSRLPAPAAADTQKTQKAPP